MTAAATLSSREVLTLPNGARIVFDPMAHLRTAAVGVWLGAGARHEAAELNGLAHFLEHMVFKGAAGRSAREIAEVVEARGSVMNAATEYERTGYFMRCLSADAPQMLDIALSLVFGPDHPAGEIEREKGVVLQELGEARDQPDDLVFELAQTASFGEHPLGRSILGTEETLRRVTREDLFGFAEANYTPARTVVSVAGAYDRAAIEDAARRWLENRAAAAGAANQAPAVVGKGVRTAVRKLEQTHLVLARPAPSALSDDRFAARIFAEIFGGGMASRLFQQVREERGLAYTIDASCDQYTDAGRISVYAGCAPGDAREVVALTTGVWADMAANGPTADELARAQAVAQAQFAMAAEAPAARAGSGAYEVLAFGRLVDVEEVLARIAAVTVADVQRIAAEALAGPPSASAVGPKAGVSAVEGFVAAG